MACFRACCRAGSLEPIGCKASNDVGPRMASLMFAKRQTKSAATQNTDDIASMQSTRGVIGGKPGKPGKPGKLANPSKAELLPVVGHTSTRHTIGTTSLPRHGALHGTSTSWLCDSNATAHAHSANRSVAEQPRQQKGIEKKEKNKLWWFLDASPGTFSSAALRRQNVVSSFNTPSLLPISEVKWYLLILTPRISTLHCLVAHCSVVSLLALLCGFLVVLCVRACARACVCQCRANQPPNERFNLQSEHRVITSHHITAPKHQPNRTQPNPTARNATSNPEAATEPPTVERYFAPIHPSLDKLWNERTNELWNELWNEVNEANENAAAAAKSQHRYTGNFHRNLQNLQNLQKPPKTSENLRKPRNLRQ